MRKSAYTLMTSLVALGASALPSAAWGQDKPAEPAPAPAPAAAAPAPPPPAPAPVEAAPPPPPPPAPAPVEAAPAAPPAPTYPSTTITGFVEGAYHRQLKDAHINAPVPTRAYDSSNGFLLHLAHLSLKHQANEHVYGVIEFDAGADAQINHNPGGYPDKGGPVLFDVQEAYGVYTDSGVTFTAGKFATYEGIEVIEGPSDPTITRGFLYFLAEPVTHVGAKLHYATGPVDIGVGLVNGWDTNNGLFSTGDNNDQKTLIWRLGVTPVPQFWAALSGTYGVEKTGINTQPRLSVDLTGAVIPADTVTINFQGNLGSEKGVGADPNRTSSWLGFGVQPVLKFDAATIGARFEFFQDKNDSRTLSVDPTVTGNQDYSFYNFTITPGYTLASAFTVRAEFRYDGSNHNVLGTDPTGGKKNQTSIALGAHYVF